MSVTRAAAIAQSASLERRQTRVNSAGVDERTRGVVHDHVPGAGGGSSAARTDSERVAPPRTPTQPAGADAPSGSATTISSIPAARSASSDHSIIGRPATSHERLRHGRTEPLAAARGHKQGYGPRRTSCMCGESVSVAG